MPPIQWSLYKYEVTNFNFKLMNNKEKESVIIFMYMHKEGWMESFEGMLEGLGVDWSHEWRLDDIMI